MKNQNIKIPTINEKFYSPLLDAFGHVKKRKCHAVSDWDHLKSGIERCLNFNSSGREWVQKIRDLFIAPSLKVGTFFASLKSSRRLNLIKQVNRLLLKNYNVPAKYDPFADIKELDNYEIFAGDGHFHEHATGDIPKNNKHYPVGHIFALNLRNQLACHLDVTRPVNKKEHEITALKRIGANALRMDVPTGTRVIMVYDPAIIDFRAWDKWKRSKGVYVVTREKSNMNPIKLGDRDFDRQDSRNAGIISDELIGTSNSIMLRRIKYKDSNKNKVYTFISNVMDVPPGVIAFIYKTRWDLEKVFDTFKNQFNEKKAWAANDNGKSQQAVFLCLAHNLLLMLERKIEEDEGIVDKKIIYRRKKELAAMKDNIESRKKPLNTLAAKLRRSVQRSLQFLRLVRVAITKETSWPIFIEQLKPYMAGYLF